MIRARFDTRCPGCGLPINEGDRIGLVDDDWCCEECVEDMGGEDPGADDAHA